MGKVNTVIGAVVGAIPVPSESAHAPGVPGVHSGERETTVQPRTDCRGDGVRQSRLSTMSSLPFLTAMKAQFPVISLETAN